MSNTDKISLIIPAKNEAQSLKGLIPKLKKLMPAAEIIIVNDGSTDDTETICNKQHVTIITNPYSMGNGAAVKIGARHAAGEIIVFLDADGQHNPEDITRLLQELDKGYDMAVGARTSDSQAGKHRAIANGIYNKLSSWMVGHEIKDLTSGMRAVRADKFRRFLYLLPNGFSYPTTITMSFFRAGFSVVYVPITTHKRIGKSHMRIGRDGVRFLLIIFKIGTLYSPLKLFLPISLVFFLTGLGYYLYTFSTMHRFTNMSALLMITSVLIFLIGLISEQISSLNYKNSE